MEDLLYSLPKYCTKETITVVGFIATAWIGWKVAAKTLGLISAAAVKFSFVGLTAAVMFLSGIGGIGWSIGDLASRSTTTDQVVGLNNDDLKDLANKGENALAVQSVLEYAKVRDSGTGEIKVQTLANLVALTNEHNKEAVVEYLKLLQKRESEKLTLNTEYDSNTPVMLAHYSANQTKSKPTEMLELVKSNTTIQADKPLVPIQMTWGTLFGGIGLIVVSFIAYGNRPVAVRGNV